jgi:uncharacterized protein YecT (DUF1311 family)
MPSRLLGAALLSAAAALAIAAQAADAGKPAQLSPPVIREDFTLLPCPKHPTTTLEQEGCAEHAIVRTDHRIDRVAKAIFTRLGDAAARRRFIDAQTAWLAYRRADCASVSDKYEGGTLAALVAASCTADRSAQHLKEVRAFDRLLRTP